MNKMPLLITQIFGLFGSSGKLMQFLSTETKKLNDSARNGATHGSTEHREKYSAALL